VNHGERVGGHVAERQVRSAAEELHRAGRRGGDNARGSTGGQGRRGATELDVSCRSVQREGRVGRRVGGRGNGVFDDAAGLAGDRGSSAVGGDRAELQRAHFTKGDSAVTGRGADAAEVIARVVDHDVGVIGREGRRAFRAEAGAGELRDRARVAATAVLGASVKAAGGEVTQLEVPRGGNTTGVCTGANINQARRRAGHGESGLVVDAGIEGNAVEHQVGEVIASGVERQAARGLERGIASHDQHAGGGVGDRSGRRIGGGKREVTRDRNTVVDDDRSGRADREITRNAGRAGSATQRDSASRGGKRKVSGDGGFTAENRGGTYEHGVGIAALDNNGADVVIGNVEDDRLGRGNNELRHAGHVKHTGVNDRTRRAARSQRRGRGDVAEVQARGFGEADGARAGVGVDHAVAHGRSQRTVGGSGIERDRAARRSEVKTTENVDQTVVLIGDRTAGRGGRENATDVDRLGGSAEALADLNRRCAACGEREIASDVGRAEDGVLAVRDRGGRTGDTEGLTGCEAVGLRERGGSGSDADRGIGRRVARRDDRGLGNVAAGSRDSDAGSIHGRTDGNGARSGIERHGGTSAGTLIDHASRGRRDRAGSEGDTAASRGVAGRREGALNGERAIRGDADVAAVTGAGVDAGSTDFDRTEAVEREVRVARRTEKAAADGAVVADIHTAGAGRRRELGITRHRDGAVGRDRNRVGRARGGNVEVATDRRSAERQDVAVAQRHIGASADRIDRHELEIVTCVGHVDGDTTGRAGVERSRLISSSLEAGGDSIRAADGAVVGAYGEVTTRSQRPLDR